MFKKMLYNVLMFFAKCLVISIQNDDTFTNVTNPFFVTRIKNLKDDVNDYLTLSSDSNLVEIAIRYEKIINEYFAIVDRIKLSTTK